MNQMLFLLILLGLTGRMTAATFTVTTTASAGPGSLREAILAANAAPDPDRIEFNIAPSNIVHVIQLAAPLPVITGPVTIDGLTQPGSAPNTLAQGFNATNLVTISGSSLGPASQNGRRPGGITLMGMIGLPGGGTGGGGAGLPDGGSGDPGTPGGGGAGTPGGGDPGTPGGGDPGSGPGNPGDPGGGGDPGPPGATNLVHGLEIRADLVTIRGLRFVQFLTDGNMTNNRSAIFMADARSNVVEACVFGVDASTSLGEPNWGGITITNGAHIRIGGTNAAQRNLISDNTAWQVRFLNSVSNVVEGNFIGLPGLTPAAFLNPGPGVVFEGGHHNRVGGAAPGARNYLGFVGGPPPAPGGGVHDMEGAILLRRSHTNTVLGNWLGLLPPEVFCRLPEGWVPCGLGVAGVSSGVALEDARDNRVGGPAAGEGNVIAGGGSGIRLEGVGSFNNLIQGNRLGTHPDGTAASTHGLTTGNLQSSGNLDGVLVRAGAHDNLIGGTGAGEGNLISNNRGHGVTLLGLETTANRVLGNFIGPDVTGTNALPNGVFGGTGDGVFIGQGASNNTMGGSEPGAGNVISGNHNHGIRLAGRGTELNRVQGNIIGPDATGTGRLPYLSPLFLPRGNVLSGVRIEQGAARNLIGGRRAGEGNLISANGEDGVSLVEDSETGLTTENEVLGNRIGTQTGGTVPLGNDRSGVRLQATGNRVGGSEADAGNVISGNLQSGVAILGNGNVIEGNFIGTDPAGLISVANQQAGVRVEGATNRIGGAVAAAGNIISGNLGPGLLVQGDRATHNEITANVIGLSAKGLVLPNNTDGVRLTGNARFNRVGGPPSSAPNVISGNLNHGVFIQATPTIGAATSENEVLGNRIGTDSTGTLARPNGSDGVSISGSARNVIARNLISANGGNGLFAVNAPETLIQANTIGAEVSGAKPLGNFLEGVYLMHTSQARVGDADPRLGNRIAFNQGHGVRVDGTSGGNAIQANSIEANGGLGIDLAASNDPDSGVTPNDALDPDAGPNALQNFPVIDQATVTDRTRIQGRLQAAPNRAFVVELFRSAAADPSGHGEGATFVARTDVATGNDGQATFTFDLEDFTGEHFTATATDAVTRDTSEFGPAVVALPPLVFEIAHRGSGTGGPAPTEFLFEFPTAPGLSYTILTNGNLATPNWGVFTNFTGNGLPQPVRVPFDLAPNLFFRLRQP